MTNEELKIKVDEFLSSGNISEDVLYNLKMFISIAILYEKLSKELEGTKFNAETLKNLPKLDLYTKIDLVKNMYKKYGYPLTDEMIEGVLSNGTIDFREYEYEEGDYLSVIRSGVVEGSAGIRNGKKFVSLPNSGYITDAILIAHELGHYTIGIPETSSDHMISEAFAIFSEFLMEDELSNLGYKAEMDYVRKLRFRDTFAKNYLIPVMAAINVYLTLGDFEYESFNKLYSNLPLENYKEDLANVKKFFNRSPRKIDIDRCLYYTFGCIYAYYMYDRLKKNPDFKENIFKAYSDPYRKDLNSFSEALGMNEINKDLEEAINAYIDEINEEKLDKSV